MGNQAAERGLLHQRNQQRDKGHKRDNVAQRHAHRLTAGGKQQGDNVADRGTCFFDHVHQFLRTACRRRCGDNPWCRLLSRFRFTVRGFGGIHQNQLLHRHAGNVVILGNKLRQRPGAPGGKHVDGRDALLRIQAAAQGPGTVNHHAQDVVIRRDIGEAVYHFRFGERADFYRYRMNLASGQRQHLFAAANGQPQSFTVSAGAGRNKHRIHGRPSSITRLPCRSWSFGTGPER